MSGQKGSPDMLAPASRKGEPTDATRAFAYSTFILSIPRVATEAITVFPGLGEDERVQYAVKRWMKNEFDFFFVGGVHQGERTARKFTIETLCAPPFDLAPEMTSQVYAQVDATNTKEQAVWVAERVRELHIRSLTITATSFHVPRAYGTLLKALLRIVPWKVALIPDPAPASPLYVSPETAMTLADMIHGEYPRIPRYQSGGDIVTLQELERHVEWLYREYL